GRTGAALGEEADLAGSRAAHPVGAHGKVIALIAGQTEAHAAAVVADMIEQRQKPLIAKRSIGTGTTCGNYV
ncbi:hypothetical protein, partial [Mesobacillus zeae]